MKIKQKELNTQLTFSRILSCTAWILILFYFPETLEVLYTKCSDRTSSVIFSFMEKYTHGLQMCFTLVSTGDLPALLRSFFKISIF